MAENNPANKKLTEYEEAVQAIAAGGSAMVEIDGRSVIVHRITDLPSPAQYAAKNPKSEEAGKVAEDLRAQIEKMQADLALLQQAQGGASSGEETGPASSGSEGNADGTNTGNNPPAGAEGGDKGNAQGAGDGK